MVPKEINKFQMRLKSENEKGSRNDIVFFSYFFFLFSPFLLLVRHKSYYFFLYMNELHVLIDFLFSFVFFVFFGYYFCNFVIVKYIIRVIFILLYFIAIDLSIMIGPIMERHGNRENHKG